MKQASLSIVTLTWNKEPRRLRDLLWTLTHQSLPPAEIIVVDGNVKPGNTKDTWDVIQQFDANIKLIHFYMKDFSLSRGFNVGIKRTSEESQYVLTTGVDMLFGEDVIEKVLDKMYDRAFCVSHCGFLIEKAGIPCDIFSVWKGLCAQINPNPPTKISTGAMICASRASWFEMRGYDEVNHPFGFTDSDVTMRMKMMKLSPASLHWGEAQLLHVWHDVDKKNDMVYGIKSARPNSAWGITRNPDSWGELE